MKLAHRTRPTVETLEDRTCPAPLVVRLDAAGNLYVTGTPPGPITLTSTAANTFSLAFGAFSASFVVPGNISLNLDNGTDTVIVNLASGFGVNGTLSATAGNGTTDSFLLLGGGGARVGGNLTLAGFETVNVLNTTVGGGLGVTNAGGGGTQLSLSSSPVGGNLSTGLGAGNNSLTLNLGSNVGGGVFYSAGTGLDTVLLSASVGGGVVLNLGGGDNALTFNAGAVVGGSMTVLGGSGTNTVQTFGGTVQGNVLFDFGNGTNVVGPTPTAFNGIINGSLSAIMGNGANTFDFDGTLVGSSFTYYGGSGVDTVTVGPGVVASGAYLNVHLGAGDDVFNLQSNLFRAGLIDGGPGSNTFNATVPINFPLVLRNF